MVMNRKIKRGINLLNEMKAKSNIVLELGCGESKKHLNAISIDAIDYPDIDLVGDVFDVLSELTSQSVGEIYSYHFFEHVKEQGGLIDECARVLAPGGKMVVVVPHFSNPFFYSDPTHERQFGLYTFSYYSDDQVLTRKVPKYSVDPKFAIASVDLIFKSYPPHYFRHGFKKMFQCLVNIGSWTKEFYEENLQGLFPCHEIKFELVRK
jgi:predicted SAM-dependent methyltransferase